MPGIKSRLIAFLRWTEKYTKTDMVYLASGGFWLTTGQVVASGSAFLLALVFANYFPKETYGEYKYVLALIGGLSAFSLTGLGVAITQATSRGYDRLFKETIPLSLKWGSGSMAVALAIGSYYLFKGNAGLGFGIAIVGTAMPLISGFGLFASYLNGKKDFGRLTRYASYDTVLTALTLGISIFLTKDLLTILCVYAASNLFFAFIFWKRTFRRDPPNDRNDPSSIGYAKHMSLINILGFVATNLDSVLVFQYLGAAQLAIYAFAVAVPQQVKALQKGITTLSMPKYASKTAEDIESGMLYKMGLIFLTTLLGIAVYYFLAPILYHFFFSQYDASIRYSQIFAFSLLGATATLPVSAVQARAETGKLYFYNTTSSVIRIAAMLIGIQFGLMGLVISRVCAQLMLIPLSYVLVPADAFFLKRLFMRSVPIAHLRCDEREIYVKDGYGGKPIECWPVYGFFAQFTSGDVSGAQEEYERWYADEFSKYGSVGKERGGMKNGSLYKKVERMHQEKNLSFVDTSPDEEIVREAIAKRVEERFGLIRSIREKGYCPSRRDVIYGVRRNGAVILWNGHHRVAALKALGYTEVPDIFIVPFPRLMRIMNS
ncbi:MAG TPA: oligosaccharide flippase family protein [Thermodesulfobacteriota bacterium]|nr:oligosaccharide flippase family protein [Thermodesulfobacteriota bacterium]